MKAESSKRKKRNPLHKVYEAGILQGNRENPCFMRCMKPESCRKIERNPLHKVDEAGIEQEKRKKPVS
jgi:hypothetical protein